MGQGEKFKIKTLDSGSTKLLCDMGAAWLPRAQKPSVVIQWPWNGMTNKAQELLFAMLIDALRDLKSY